MEVAFDPSTTSTQTSQAYSLQSDAQNSNALLVDTLLSSDNGTDETSVDLFGDPNALLGLNAQKIYDAIQEVIKKYSPETANDSDSEMLPTSKDTTPQSTAQFIVAGVALLFDGYAKSNPELSAKDQIEKFIAAAREGVQTGYDEAYDILDTLGAFTIDGVKTGVEQTKVEIEKGLAALERYLKDQHGVKDASDTTTQTTTTNPQNTTPQTVNVPS